MAISQFWVVQQMEAIEALAEAWQITPAMGLAIRIAAAYTAYNEQIGLITEEVALAAYARQFEDFERLAKTCLPRPPRHIPCPRKPRRTPVLPS